MFELPPDPKDPHFWEKMRRFVVKEHHASSLHWDLRLEMAGVAKSLVLPKGPCLDPTVTRLAVQVEDHSLRSLLDTGTIPEGRYGAGKRYPWDQGMYTTLEPDPLAAWEHGELRLTLHGQRLNGGWRLSSVSGRGRPEWLLRKCEDEYALRGHIPEIMGANDPQPAFPASASSQILLPFTDEEMQQSLTGARPGHRRKRRRAR